MAPEPTRSPSWSGPGRTCRASSPRPRSSTGRRRAGLCPLRRRRRQHARAAQPARPGRAHARRRRGTGRGDGQQLHARRPGSSPAPTWRASRPPLRRSRPGDWTTISRWRSQGQADIPVPLEASSMTYRRRASPLHAARAGAALRLLRRAGARRAGALEPDRARGARRAPCWRPAWLPASGRSCARALLARAAAGAHDLRDQRARHPRRADRDRRLGDLPSLGQTDITLEATVYGAVLGLRAVALVLCGALYSARGRSGRGAAAVPAVSRSARR